MGIPLTWARGRMLGAAWVVLLLACSSPTEPGWYRSLGSLVTPESGLEGENPIVTVLPDRVVRIQILTRAGCGGFRADTKVIRRERAVIIYPYQYTADCGARVLGLGEHDLKVHFDAPGRVYVRVLGARGGQGHSVSTAVVNLE